VATGERPFDVYVPRGVLRHLATEPFRPVRTVAGSMLFADLSGFTKLSERLQRRGPEGAELLVNTINGVFDHLLRVAYDNGGSLIKFGGDALLLFFEGDRHAERASRSAFRMRERLRTVGRIEVAGVRGVLRMTVGVHSDEFHFVLVGESHLEHLVLGPGAKGTVDTEAIADNGQIVISAATAALLPSSCVGPATGEGFLLRSAPMDRDLSLMEVLDTPPNDLVARALSTAVRAHVTAGRAPAEHRRACVAFLQFKGTNGLIATEGVDAAAAAVHELVADAQRAADDWQICFLDSDIDADGGKLLFAAGAPRVVGDDEERLLLALRQILDGSRRLPIRIGVNRGPVFTGEIGPPYRRAYTVMGDTTNLAARVMGKSRMGELWATPGILDRSTTKFDTVQLEPFAAKGKAALVQAYSVGPPLRVRPVVAEGAAPELVGRDAELERLCRAQRAAGQGRGSLVELLGEPGVGKSRLAAALPVEDVRLVHVTCESHLAAVPYSLWHGLLRRLLGLARADPVERVGDVLARAATRAGVAEYLPLLGTAIGLDLPETPTTANLLPQFCTARLHEAVLALLAPELGRPTRLEIEGVQLIDEASAGLMAALASRVADSRWLVLALRRHGPGHAYGEPAERIELGPLTPAQSTALAHAVTDTAPLPPHRVEAVVQRAGGNPQFLLDLLAAAGGDLPDSAQAAAMAQIDALGPGDRSLVRRAGALGSVFPPALAAAVLGPDADADAWARLDPVLATTPDGHLRFRRDAVQEAAYAGVPFAERRALHADIAAALQEGLAGAVDPGVLGRHYRLAEQPERAYPLFREAAEAATASAAPVDAAAHYRAALDSGRATAVPPAELAVLWEGLGDALRLAAEGPAADRAYREARRAVGADPLRQAQLMHRQARLAQRAGHPATGVRWARRGRRLLDGVPAAEAWRARLLAAEAANRMDQGRRREAVRLCEAALQLAGPGTDEIAQRAIAHAGFLLDWALVTLGRPAEATHSARSLEIYRGLGELEDSAHVLNNMGMFAYWAGRWDDAVALYRECGDVAARIGDEEVVATSRANVGEVLADQGHLAEGETALRDALRIWRAAGNHGGTGFARMLLGRSAARGGRFADAFALLEEAITDLAGHGMQDAVLAESYLAEALALAGEYDRAVVLLDKLDRLPGAPRPLLLRVRAMTASDPRPGLRDALDAARDEESDHDVALTLDLLIAQPDPGPAADELRAERDALFSRLGVVSSGSAPR
jgi:class 3 adenylate cyclase/tetratricopeptide (TPR) repeat protein